MNIDSILKVVRGIVRIRGATDNTLIGNVGDKLKVDAEISAVGQPSDAPGCPVFSSEIETIFSETDLALTTSYVTRFTYSGSGKLIGYIAGLNSTNFSFKLTIDSNVVFDISGNNINDIQLGPPSAGLPQPTSGGPFVNNSGKTFGYLPICPIAFSTNVKIEVKKGSGPAATILRDLINLTKET